jgi:hypothetical protein
VSSVLDVRPLLDPIFNAFGVAALVTPKGGSPISTTAVWLGPRVGIEVGTVAGRSVGPSSSIPDMRSRWRLRRDEVATLPIGSTIFAASAPGGRVSTWVVERVDNLDPEVLDVVVEGA